MQKLLRTAAALLSALAALAALPALADDPAPNPPPAASQFVELSAHDQVRQMGRGVNVIGTSRSSRRPASRPCAWCCSPSTCSMRTTGSIRSG
jgi:hypothetical protein